MIRNRAMGSRMLSPRSSSTLRARFQMHLRISSACFACREVAKVPSSTKLIVTLLRRINRALKKGKGDFSQFCGLLSDGEQIHPKMISRLPPLKILRMIMLRKRDNSFASVRRNSSMI